MVEKKSKQNIWPMVGTWAFIIGLLIAVLAGIFAGLVPETAFVLGLLGLIVGLVNVKEDEVHGFLVATIAFMISAGSLADLFGRLPQGVGASIVPIFSNVVAFVAPAAAIVALKALYDISRSA